ncbi:MAG: hypothetical protein KBD64_01905 [Gammaproteobacteria bacterium]|nr:hypothetical protein [Gammaproteobacteria bacterium]
MSNVFIHLGIVIPALLWFLSPASWCGLVEPEVLPGENNRPSIIVLLL